MSVSLEADNLPSKDLQFTNYVYVSPVSYDKLRKLSPVESVASNESIRCEIHGSVMKSFVWNVVKHKDVATGSVAMNLMHRKSAKISLKESVFATPWYGPYTPVANASLVVSLFVAMPRELHLVDLLLERDLKDMLKDQALTNNQVIAMLVKENNQDIPLRLCVSGLEGPNSSSIRTGLINADSEFFFSVNDESKIRLKARKSQQKMIFHSDFDLERLGIGGLDDEFSNIFRRAFESRIFPGQVDAMGLSHVRGMLLHGPPGTGKTLIARQIGKALKANEPKIVNGPEVLNKYVGESEANIRSLFAEAEAEYKKKGDNSSLHIIIFDEIDAICKTRGTVGSGTGVNDSVVNQLLSKIDGVDALNNILLIGMTNRLDLIDEALLRPGRLEVHVEIGLPDESGRVQILNIHTAKMRESNHLHKDVNIAALASKTQNYSGAEIEGLIRSAASFAFHRHVDMKNLGKPINTEDVLVTRADFELALTEVRPAFGFHSDALQKMIKHAIIHFDKDVEYLEKTLVDLGGRVLANEENELLSVLLMGPNGSGKSALAAHVAMLLKFPFTKVIDPSDFVGYSEHATIQALSKIFSDAHKSSASLVLIDKVELLIDYSRIGPRYSNSTLKAIYRLIQSPPKKKGRRIFIIATTSEKSFFQEEGFSEQFSRCYDLPLVDTSKALEQVLKYCQEKWNNIEDSEIEMLCKKIIDPVGIKQLLTTYEIASELSKPGPVRHRVMVECLRQTGVDVI